MGLRRRKEYDPRRVWTPFDREAYHWAWVDKKLSGVIRAFRKDLKYCKQRINRGWCDADLYSVCDWFLAMVPAMLEQYQQMRHGSPSILGENYQNEDGILVNDTCHEEWDAILERMIFLFHEADEWSCQRKNPYEGEYTRVCEEFDREYGDGLVRSWRRWRRKGNGCGQAHTSCIFHPRFRNMLASMKCTRQRRKSWRSTKISARARRFRCSPNGFPPVGLIMFSLEVSVHVAFHRN